MTTPEVIKYIQEEINKGTAKDSIRASLLNNGWVNADIDEAFQAAAPTNTQSAAPPQPDEMLQSQVREISQNPTQPKSNKKRHLLKSASIAFIALLIIAAGGALYADTKEYIDLPFSVPFVKKISPEQVLNKSLLAAANLTSAEFTGTGTLNEIELAFSGAQDISDAENQKISLMMSGTFEERPYFGAELRYVDKKIYGKITQAPEMPFFDLNDYVNRWFFVDQNELFAQATSVSGFSDFMEILDQAKKEREEMRSFFFEKATQHPPFTVTEDMGADTVNGVATLHYKIGLNTENILLITKAIGEKYEQFSEQNPLEAVTELETDFEKIDIEVWISKKDFQIRKVALFVSSELNQELDSPLSMTIFLDEHNKPVTVTTPEEATAILELVEPFLNQSQARAVDASVRVMMSQLRTEAELETGAPYENVCQGPNFKELLTEINTLTGSQTICKNSNGKYAVEATLGDGTKFCVDSTGFAGEGAVDANAISCAQSDFFSS